MLSDPINARLAAASCTSPINIPLIEVEQGHTVGRRVRVGEANGSDFGVSDNSNLTVTFSRSSTKENKPHGTDRVSIRVDRAIPSAQLPEGAAPSSEFGQIVIGFPKGQGVSSSPYLAEIRQVLGSILLYGLGGSDTTITHAEGNTFWERLRQGEL